MKQRRKLKRSKSKKLFKRTVNKTHKFNVTGRPIMRGGIRL